MNKIVINNQIIYGKVLTFSVLISTNHFYECLNCIRINII